jgi:hypothetical protein
VSTFTRKKIASRIGNTFTKSQNTYPFGNFIDSPYEMAGHKINTHPVGSTFYIFKPLDEIFSISLILNLTSPYY